jgi:hypothetical protein
VAYNVREWLGSHRGTSEKTTEHKTRHGRVQAFEYRTQGDEGPEEPVSEPDATGRNDQGSNLRAPWFSRMYPLCILHDFNEPQRETR